MSFEIAAEYVCYVHCNFCNTVLAVSVPCNNLFNIVTVRCGHCSNLLSVNMGGLLQTIPPQALQNNSNIKTPEYGIMDHGSSSAKYYNLMSTLPNSNSPMMDHQNQRILPIPPPEKRQRAPSAYNRFIKEEIQRIKASNPDITHREAFSSAAKNWAHFPRIHFGLTLEAKNQMKLDGSIAAEAMHGRLAALAVLLLRRIEVDPFVSP